LSDKQVWFIQIDPNLKLKLFRFYNGDIHSKIDATGLITALINFSDKQVWFIQIAPNLKLKLF